MPCSRRGQREEGETGRGDWIIGGNGFYETVPVRGPAMSRCWRKAERLRLDARLDRVHWIDINVTSRKLQTCDCDMRTALRIVRLLNQR